jgi:hypothetical protein
MRRPKPPVCLTVQRHWESLWVKVSTDEGTQTDESEGQEENADISKRESVEPASNVTLERASHSEKQPSQRTLTDEGTQMDESEEQAENASPPIRDS